MWVPNDYLMSGILNQEKPIQPEPVTYSTSVNQ